MEIIYEIFNLITNFIKKLSMKIFQKEGLEIWKPKYDKRSCRKKGKRPKITENNE